MNAVNPRRNKKQIRAGCSRHRAASQALYHLEERSAALHHDTLNCLGTLRLRLQLLRRQHILDDHEGQFLEENVARLELLLREWHQLIHEDTAAIRHQAFDLVEVIRELVEANQPQALLKHHALMLTLGCDKAPVIGHLSEIQRALDNLIHNALKFTPDGGRIDVSVAAQGQTVLIRIADNGIGIPLHEQSKVFKAHYRASNATYQAIPGSGLGLAQVHQAINQHNGMIRLESEPGQGTIVMIVLPLASGDDALL